MEINKSVNGTTKLIGVIGNPIEHTLSPQLQNTIFNILEENYVYVPFLVNKEKIEEAVKGFLALKFCGFNITVPYKNDIIPFLDEVSKEAEMIGAVNTVKIDNGKLYGYNTDAEGFYGAFKHETKEDLKGKNIVIIGAGGAARAVAIKCVIEGSKSVSIINRSTANAKNISEIIKNNLDYIVPFYETKDEQARISFSNADVIINATSVGMFPDTQKSPIGDNYVFTKGQIVFDLIYNPSKTLFLEKAEKAGCRIFNGIGMLFYQGIYANEIWTGRKIKSDAVIELYEAFKNLLTE